MVRLSLEALESRLNPANIAILDQVSHFYQVAVDRSPDTQGLAFYSAQLENGVSPQSVAHQIATSTEHNEKVVTGYYAGIFNRQPDAAGLASHVAALGRGVSEERLVASLLASAERSADLTNPAYIQLLYTTVLGRAADQGGQEFWVGTLESGASRQAVALAFLESREASTNVVDGLYASVLGRQPASAEKQGWINLLERPDVSFADAASAFLGSAEALARVAGSANPLMTVIEPSVYYWQRNIGLAALDGIEAPAAALKLNPVVQLSHFGQDIAFTETQTGITSIPITNPGAGYTQGSDPSIITIAPPAAGGGTAAKATANVSDGVINQLGLTIGNNKTGAYKSSTPVVTITDTSASPGSGAVITLHVDGDGNVQYINNFTGGTGFHLDTTTIKVTGALNAQGQPDSSLDATITITSTGIVDGAISAIKITNPGSGYAPGESVQITVQSPPANGVPATLGKNDSVTASQYEGPSHAKFQAWAKDYITYVANTGVSTCFINIGDYLADTKGLYNYLRPDLGTNGIPWIVTDFLDPLANLKKPDGSSAVEVGAIAYLKDAWHLYDKSGNPNYDGNLLISDGQSARTDGTKTVYSPPKNNMYQALQLVNEINSYASTKFITHFEFDGEGGGAFVQDDPSKGQPSFYGFNTSTSDTEPLNPNVNWTYDPANPSKSNWPTTGPGYTKWLWNHLMPGVAERDLAPGGKMPGSQSGVSPATIPAVVFTDTQAVDPATWSENKYNNGKPYQFGSISYSQPAWFPSSPGPVQSYSENYWWGENNYMPGDSSALRQNPDANGLTTFKTTDTTTYSSEPLITFNTPSGGNPAAGYAILNDSGVIDHIVVSRFGDHYQLNGQDSPAYSINGGQFIPVPLENSVDTSTYNKQYAPIFALDGGFIINGNGLSLVNVVDGGAGYSAGCQITTPDGQQATYDVAPLVTFSNAAGDSTGTGAQAFATLDQNGKITSLQITNPGTGYTREPIISIQRATGDPQTGAVTDTAQAWVINYPRVSINPASAAQQPSQAAQAYAVVKLADPSKPDYGTGYTVSSIQFTETGAGYFPPSTGSGLPIISASLLPTLSVSLPAGSGARQARVDGQLAIVNKWNAFWVDGRNSITNEIGSADTAKLESIGTVTVSNPGSGYGWDAQVTFSAPENPGEMAVGYVVLNSDNSVNRIAITNPGSGYASPPKAIVSSPGNIGTGALLTVDTLVPKIRGGGNVYNYQIWNGTGSSGTNQVFSANSADAVYAHYADSPESLALMFNDPKYTAEPSLKKLSDRSYQKLNLNQDFKQITPNLPGNGISQGAIATFSLESVLLSNTGAAAVQLGAGGGATASATTASGAISAINVTNPGAKYLVAPLVQITDPKGSGATATAILAANGTISQIKVTAGGSGYTTPSVSLISQGACLDAKYQDPSQLLEVNALGGTFGGLSMLTYNDFITFLNTAADIVVGSQETSGVNLQPADYTTSGNTITSAVTDFQNIRQGMTVEGVGIPAGTVVNANPVATGNSFSVTLSNPVTGTPGALNFYNPISASDVTFSIYDSAFLPLSWLDGQVTNGWKEPNTAPAFSNLLTTGTVAPNALAGTVIHTEVATDNDLLAANKRITYDLKRGQGDDASLLKINPSSGQVMLRYAASQFPRQSYTFTVVATDGGGLSVEKIVTVPVATA